MKLIISVVSTNNRQLLKSCLDSIYKNSPSCTFETWVVDNASDDGTNFMLSSCFPQVGVIRNDSLKGAAFNRNRIYESAKGDYYLQMSEDTVVLEGTVDRMLAVIKSNSNIGILGCKTLNPDGSVQNASYAYYPSLLREITRALIFPRLIKKIFNISKWPGDLWPNTFFYENSGEMATVNGCFYLLRKELIDSVGIMDEWYFIDFEDTDFMFRAKQAGWKIWYTPAASVVHKGGGATGGLNRKRTASTQHGMYYFFRKFYGIRITRVLWWAEILSGPLLFPLFLCCIGQKNSRSKLIRLIQAQSVVFEWHLKHLKSYNSICSDDGVRIGSRECSICQRSFQ